MTILNELFSADQLSEEAMYFIEMHGFLTSLAIQPAPLANEHLMLAIFGDNAVKPNITQAINVLQENIQKALLNGDFPNIYSDDEDEDSLTLWTSGFMQGVFSQEDLWFKSHPDEVAELTLPILTCSELLDDEINQHDDILDDMAEKIPDCVIDLYLLFNSPD
jgi:uncharacterized protein